MGTAPPNLPTPWRTAGADNSRAGLSLSRGPGPRARWRTLKLKAPIQASVVFDTRGTAFAADMAGNVTAFSAGKRKWQLQLNGAAVASPALDPHSRALFAGTTAGFVYAIDTGSGRLQWQQTIPTRSDPRILSDLLYSQTTSSVVLSSWGGRFHRLEQQTGAIRHSWEAGIFPASAAAEDEAGTLFCLRVVAGKGTELFRVNRDGVEKVLHLEPEQSRGARRTLASAGPVLDLARDTIYALLNYDRGSVLRAWSRTTGEARWNFAQPVSSAANPCIRPDGTIGLANLDGSIQLVNPDGSPGLRYASGCEYLLAAPVSDFQGRMFVGDPLGCIHELSPAGHGKILLETARSIQGRPSFASNGDLYVPGTDGQVHVLPAT